MYGVHMDFAVCFLSMLGTLMVTFTHNFTFIGSSVCLSAPQHNMKSTNDNNNTANKAFLRI